jgi:hypothetical protein
MASSTESEVETVYAYDDSGDELCMRSHPCMEYLNFGKMAATFVLLYLRSAFGKAQDTSVRDAVLSCCDDWRPRRPEIRRLRESIQVSSESMKASRRLRESMNPDFGKEHRFGSRVAWAVGECHGGAVQLRRA